MFWDRRASYADLALSGADSASSADLRQKIAALDALLAAKNQEIAAIRAAKGSTGALMRDYLDLTKARDILKGKLKIAEAMEAKGRTFAPLAPAPRPTQTAFPIETEKPIVPGTCYEGRVPNDRYWRGVQVGSDEPFKRGDHLIVRSDACEKGWMVFDPSRSVARPASAGPVIRRRQVGGW